MKNPVIQLGAIMVVGFLILSTLLIAAGSGYADNGEKVYPLSTVSVTTINLQESYTHKQNAIGRVEPVQTTHLGFDRAGQINALVVEEGENIVSGQVMARLEMSRLDAQIAQANSALLRAKADAHLAELTKNRVASLVEQNLDSDQRLDEALANLDVSNATVEQAESALNALTVEQEKSTLIAPYNGTVTQRHQDSGAVINTGQPVFTIEASQASELRVALSSGLASALKIGDNVPIKGFQESATLQRFVQQQDALTRTQDAIFTFELTQKRPLSGELFTLEFEVESPQKGVWLPLSALNSGIRGMWTVFAVKDLDKPIIETRLVSLVYTDGDRVYVTGALSDGDNIVVEGTQRVVPGQHVTVSEG